MRSLRSLVLFGLLALAAQARAADVAVLKSADSPAWRPMIESLKRAATSQTFTEYDLKGDKAEADRVVASLKGQAAAIVALGPLAAQAAHQGAPELPLIVCMVQDPERLGLIAAPGLSGIVFQIPVKNQLAAFRMVNPRAVRIGVIYSPENYGQQVQEALRAMNMVRLVVVDKAVSSNRDVPQALRSLLSGGDAVDALWLPPDPILLSAEARRFILSETLKAGKPVYTFSPALVQEGALVSDGPDLSFTGDQAAELLGRMLGSEKNTRIDFMIPKSELVINKRIADRLRVEIPADALKAAAKVY
jgi:putative tryptophan/tyrosine transport system substrate-binding protein